MAAPNAVASAESWRRRVLKEQFAAARESRFGRSGPSEEKPTVAHNTLGVPNVRPGSKKLPTYSTGRAHQSSMQGSGLIPQDGDDYHAMAQSRGQAAGQPARTQQRRTITGSVNGYAGSAAAYRHGSGSQASSRRSTARPTPPASSGSWASDALPPFQVLSKLEALEQQLAAEQVRREKAEREMAMLKQQGRIPK